MRQTRIHTDNDKNKQWWTELRTLGEAACWKHHAACLDGLKHDGTERRTGSSHESILEFKRSMKLEMITIHGKKKSHSHIQILSHSIPDTVGQKSI